MRKAKREGVKSQTTIFGRVTTLCIFVYFCGCVCTQIYNVYYQDQTDTCGRPRQAHKLAFLQIPSNQYAFNIYYIFNSHRKIGFLVAEKGGGPFIVGHDCSLPVFSTNLLLGLYSACKANNPVLNGLHFPEASLMFPY